MEKHNLTMQEIQRAETLVELEAFKMVLTMVDQTRANGEPVAPTIIRYLEALRDKLQKELRAPTLYCPVIAES